MKFRRSARPAIVTILAGFLLAGAGCRKAKQTGSGKPAGPPLVVANELLSNRVGELPGAIYRSQAGSAIRWQPWTQETMGRAKAANRLVLAVIAMPQQPGYQEVLAALEADPARVAQINDSYVPILIDGDSSREMGLVTADFCKELKLPLQLPLFVWMTYDANPVAWLPISVSSVASLPEIFEQSHTMVVTSWAEDSSYVLKNSALDNAGRRSRFDRSRTSRTASEKPAEDTLRAVRQLASYYDAPSHTFDEAGGLFPAGAISLLATASLQPGVPAEIRKMALETTRGLLADILPSAMFDPLDGGVFTSRLGSSWSFPSFARNCGTQARAAIALFEASQATGNQAASDKAEELISFAEKNFQTSEELFAIGQADMSDPADWLWSVEEIEKELPAEDAAWWIRATGMKNLGNLPSEADPRREHFHRNSLGLIESPGQIAARLGVPVAEFLPRFETVRKKLLKVRNARRGTDPRDDSSDAGCTFRMVSAYAAAFAATGKESYRQKAVSLLEKARAAFSDGTRLREFSRTAPPSVGEGRAFLYGLALQAALDISCVSPDEKWLLWADDLATTAAERFGAADFLKECPDDAKIMNLPITDLVMLFGDSTAGLISLAEARLAARGRPLVESFSKLATPIPSYIAQRPILHTDLLEAALARHFPVTVIAGADLPSELASALERLPLRVVQRRMAKRDDDVPAKSVKILVSDAAPRIVATAVELRQAVVPTPVKPSPIHPPKKISTITDP